MRGFKPLERLEEYTMRSHVQVASALLLVLITGNSAVGQERKAGETLTWGSLIDPDLDCKVEQKGKTVTINIPGKLHDLSPGLPKLNAPRILQNVRGDFIVEVEAVGTVAPGGGSTNPRGFAYNGVGLLLWQDDRNMVRLERAATLRDGQVLSYVNFEHHESNQPSHSRSLQAPDRPLHLRLERKGDNVIGSVSTDGITWKAFPQSTIALPDTVKVGVAAVNSAKQPFQAELKDFRLFSRTTAK
jgi:regulation of enolase protein 1 (concanavalin A-like superfamily)